MNADASYVDLKSKRQRKSQKLPEGIDVKAIISSNWIDHKRERKKNTAKTSTTKTK